MTTSENNTKLWCILMTGLNAMVAVFVGFASPSTMYRAGPENPWYAFITTHFSHIDHQHLFSNLTALWLLNSLFPIRTSLICAAYLTCIMATAWYAGANHTEAYLGFSALLYCHPGCYLIKTLCKGKFIASGMIIWVLCCQLYIMTPLHTSPLDSWIPMSDAHLIGFFSGTLVTFFHQIYHEHLTSTRHFQDSYHHPDDLNDGVAQHHRANRRTTSAHSIVWKQS